MEEKAGQLFPSNCMSLGRGLLAKDFCRVYIASPLDVKQVL